MDYKREKLLVMFDTITWAQYFTTVLLLLIFYYGTIGILYYRWEILSVLGIKKAEDNTIAISTVADLKKSFDIENHEDYFPNAAVQTDISLLVLSVTDEIKAYLLESNRDIIKVELLHSIKAIILKYPVLKDADCKQELIQFVFDEANAKYPNLLQLKEIKQLLN